MLYVLKSVKQLKVFLGCCIDAQFKVRKESPEFKGRTGESGSALGCANRVDRA